MKKSVDGPWREHIARITAGDRTKWLGDWIRRSADGGRTWGEFIDSLVTAPRAGRVEGWAAALSGDQPARRLGAHPRPAGQRVAAAESRDDGRTWSLIGFVPIPKGVAESGFHEPTWLRRRTGSWWG